MNWDWTKRAESIVKLALTADKLRTPGALRQLQAEMVFMVNDIDQVFDGRDKGLFDLWRDLLTRVQDAEIGDDLSLRCLQSELLAMVNAVVELRVARAIRDATCPECPICGGHYGTVCDCRDRDPFQG